MPNSITYDAIQQGLIHIPYRVQVGTPNDRFLQSMLFGARPVSGELNAGGSIFFDLRRIGAELPDELPLENEKTYTVTKVAIEYTATVIVDGAETTVTYTVENKAEKLAEIAAMLPANTAEYTYAWAETLPAELPLENGKAYTVTKTAVVVTPPTSEDPDNSEEPTTSEQPTTSEPSSSESGCSGSVGGLSAGVLALGAAVMLLKKRQ